MRGVTIPQGNGRKFPATISQTKTSAFSVNPRKTFGVLKLEAVIRKNLNGAPAAGAKKPTLMGHR